MPIELLRRIRTSKFVSRERTLESAIDIILWWEARRILFNLIVGFTGIVTCAGLLAIGIIGDYFLNVGFDLPDPPFIAILGVIAFGIMANVCYTGGWIVELLVRRTWPEESHQAATLSFTLGLVLAVLITLLPIPLFGILMLLASLPIW